MKEMVLVQPDKSDVKIDVEKEAGHVHDIDEWYAKMNEVVLGTGK